ncbi:phage integrase SAM-like domain-containing protein [Flavobacterium sp. M31R6]|uniref:phage integrase SAM-like domain-containing protein n=1 Tax=Flavobacterium sp. M31R6 TaxID=2739062 RepID=UPI001568CD5C|nr:phage integrase SAM-like domain-containing protein [Flavobacterium sp. M31R6]QKJ62305.1 phage integrase SAM-like domain-containing protein [Flavobacterium sp. M31R6]
MASFKFFTKGNGNLSTIYVRFYHGRKIDITKSTSLLINPKFWNNTKGVVKQISEFSDKINFQKKLSDLENAIIDNFNNDYANGIIINAEWLEVQLNKHLNRKEITDLNYFINYAENYLKKLPSTKRHDGKMGVTKATITKIKTVIKKVTDYEKHFKKKLLLTDINLKFHENFIYYLHDIEKLNFNTVGKYIQFVKTIVYDAKNHDLNINHEIEKKEFKQIREKTTFVTLSENEIDLIFNKDFSDKPSLDNARNWLIIGVWTGARAGDLLNFTDKKINNNFIEYVAQKTQQKIVIPMHWQVKAILEKCNGLPHKISTQKYNDYIKLVCQEVGLNELIEGSKSVDINNKENSKIKKPKIFRKQKDIYKKWELVSTHIARRSFATNHYGKLPTPVLMSATGHTTEKMFLAYIGKSSIDNAEILRTYWNKLEQIKEQKTVLQIAN